MPCRDAFQDSKCLSKLKTQAELDVTPVPEDTTEAEKLGLVAFVPLYRLYQLLQVFPLGIVKFNKTFVPLIVTIALVPASPVVVVDRAAALMPVHRCGRHVRYEDPRDRLARPCSWLARLPVHAAALTRAVLPV